MQTIWIPTTILPYPFAYHLSVEFKSLLFDTYVWLVGNLSPYAELGAFPMD